MPPESAAQLIDAHVRTVPDFPEPGILFRDITPVFADGPTFTAIVHALVDAFPTDINAILGVEARGFGLAAATAFARGVGMVPIRKQGKLPGPVLAESYELEYGSAALELQPDALPRGSRVVIVDDLLATGGTLAASVRLAEAAGWSVVSIGVVIELLELNGRSALVGHDVTALTAY